MRAARGALRRHTVLVIVLASALALAACGSNEPRASDTPTSRATARSVPLLLAPRSIPEGWFVATAVARHVNLTPVQTLYARRGFDPAHDAALLIAEVGQDVDMATPALDETEVSGLGVPGHRYARIGHFGDYSVVTWYRVPESTTVVIARGLSDEQLIAVARAAEFKRSALSIPDAALPDGFETVATSRLLPRQRGAAEERIWLADARWNLVQVMMSDLNDDERLVDGFLSTYPGIEVGRPGRGRIIDGRDVFVRGNAPAAIVDAVAQSIGPVTRRAWREFQREVLDVPDSLMFAGCRTLDGIVVISGVHDRVRWGVAMPTPRAAQPCSGVARFEVGYDANGPGGTRGPASAMSGGPGSFGITDLVGEIRSVGLADASLTTGGTAPAETTRVVVGSGDQEVEAKLSDAPDRVAGEPRYYGAYLDLNSLRDDMRVTAYAADGRVVGRLTAPEF